MTPIEREHHFRRTIFECGVDLRDSWADKGEDLARGLVMAAVAILWIAVLIVASIAWLIFFPCVWTTGAIGDAWRPVGRLIRMRWHREDETS